MHILITAAGVILITGVPLYCTGYITSLISGSADSVAGASLVLDQPSGEYIVMINKKLRADEETLNDWVRFFSNSVGEDELLVIFEDIACSVAQADAAGSDMAESFQSRLPENQMKINKEDATLIMSRADQGLFDVIIMSREFADIYHAETAFNENVEVVELVSR